MNAASVTQDDLAWLERACLGQDMPPGAEQSLRLAAQSYSEPEQAEKYLAQALELAPSHPAVYIAFYRHHFYGGRIREALPYSTLCLALARRELGLAGDWWEVAPEDGLFGDVAAFGPRFFLFSLKAYGYLQMRLGNLDEGRRAVNKVLQLDPTDKVGAAVLLDVLNRLGQPDEDE
ncbi:MAG: hypothetical protein KGZ83_01060 [Sulfuricella sp.]|nr:hypothetical protein [Sulfuricella sp.]